MSRDLAWALRRLGKQVTHVADIGELGQGAPDYQIMEYAAERGIAVVSRDRDFRELQWLVHDIKQLNAQAFYLDTGKGGRRQQVRAWEIVKLVVKSWEEMERFYEARRHASFMAIVKKNGRVSSYN